MVLKIKPTPAHLLPDRRVEAVWPGDDAVEQSCSDLSTWCHDGHTDGRAGLTLIPGAEPSVITWRPLGAEELAVVSESMLAASTLYPYEAARYGILSISGLRLQRERRGGLLGLTDLSLAQLSELVADLPYGEALDALAEAQGRQVAKDDSPRGLVTCSLAEVVGVHILTASFRLRRGSA